MCIIVAKNRGGALPQEAHLRNCENSNKDGIGIAVLKAGKSDIQIKKDFKDIDAFITWFYANVKEEDACIIHYRYATHGLKDVGNRHPFPITKNKEMLRQSETVCQIAMAHNGVISQYGAHAKFSDTQKFVLDILSDESIKTNLASPAVQKLISNFLGNDRLAIMLVDGTIWMWGDWVDEGNIKYSNTGYKQEKVIKGFSNLDKPEWMKKAYGYIDNCEACGEKTFIQATAETFYYGLCKTCRKKLRKNKLETIGGLPIKELKEMARDIAEDDAAWRKYEAIEDKYLSDVQCESCYDWIDKKEIMTYYGTKICQKCLDEVTLSDKGFNHLRIRDNV